MTKNIAIIRGDGIGPEIMAEAISVLNRIAEKFGHTFNYTEAPMGGEAIDKFEDPLPQSSLDTCLNSDSVLLSAVGGPKWDSVPKEKRPERGLLRLRAGMELYANIRPAQLFDELRDASPLKPSIVDKGIDFVVVRELIGGAYFGEHRTEKLDGEYYAQDIMAYSEHEIERIAHVAFQTAQKRRKAVCSVDKANVLDSSKLWRKVVTKVAESYPDVTLSHMYVDNCAMQLVKDPSQFDVIVTENLFGDILSDEASMITGSIGMIPSSSLGDGTRGLYEPIHGSAPDIAGTDTANPIGMILSAAMMLRYSFDMSKEADAVEKAVDSALKAGFRTVDAMSEGKTRLGCRAMGKTICDMI
ncbi:MAG: 3-isopropylmalate dehydrogenase [Clostridiales bacterium]|jgi:3-isopropylmalate dehydrogenase|nr:3-isopropylmalate dehydrogenase [Clostridiales bacterium]